MQYTVGDALVLGITVLFLRWGLMCIWPKTFGSPLMTHLRLNNELRESALETFVLKTVRNAIAEHEQSKAKDRETVRPIEDVMIQSGMTGHPPSGDYASRKVVENESGHDSQAIRASNIGRAHVAEDGAFAGGLLKEERDRWQG